LQLVGEPGSAEKYWQTDTKGQDLQHAESLQDHEKTYLVMAFKLTFGLGYKEYASSNTFSQLFSVATPCIICLLYWRWLVPINIANRKAMFLLMGINGVDK
jgi:hypothetical protein